LQIRRKLAVLPSALSALFVCLLDWRDPDAKTRSDVTASPRLGKTYLQSECNLAAENVAVEFEAAKPSARVALSLLIAIVLLLTDCGGGGSGMGGGNNVTPSATVTSVTVSCNPSAVQTGQASQCSATVMGTGNYSSAVTWSVDSGTISSSGVYTAPAAAPASGKATITATSTQDTSKSNSVSLTVTTPAAISSVSVTCSPSSVQTNQASTCTPTVIGTGNFSSTVTWSVNPSNIGTVSSSGVFTPTAAGTATIIATSTQDSTKFGSVTVTVTVPTSISSVSASCASTSLQVGQTTQCSAVVQGTGSYSSSVNWSVNSTAGGNSTLGTISNTGLYTAPTTVPNPASVTITATSSSDTTKSASVLATIKLTIAISPQTPTIQLFHTQQFTATVTGVTNTSVSWSVNGINGGNNVLGQITNAGLYVPPVVLPTSSTITITASSQADATETASAVALLTPDTTPLAVTGVSPVNNSTNVSSQTSVAITFNEGLDPATINTASISLAASGANVPIQYSYDSTSYTVILIPVVLLSPSATYSMSVGLQLKDLGGNSLASPYASTFTVQAPLSLAANVIPPTGVNATTLTAIGFQGQQSTVDSNGNFNAATSAVGPTLVSVVLPSDASALMAIAIGDLPATTTASSRMLERSASSATAQNNGSFFANASKPMVKRLEHEITASNSPTSSGGFVVDFETTAEAVLFLSPALFRTDTQGLVTIMGVIAGDPNTQVLASALQQSWNEPHPLQDPLVSAEYTTALRSILTTLVQQTAGIQQTAGPQSVRNSTRIGSNAIATSSPAISAQGGATAVSVSYTSIDVCCISVDSFTVSGSNYVSTAAVNGVSLSNVFGNAAGWVMRVVPLAPDFDPSTFQPANGETTSPDSPGPVRGEDNQEVQPLTWIPGNSVLQYGDLYGDVYKLGTWISSIFTSEAPTEHPNITLPNTQPAFYLVRYFSGGLADNNEFPLVANSYKSDLTGGIYKGQQLWSAALVANYVTNVANLVLHDKSPSVSTCLANGLIGDGTTAQIVLDINPSTAGNWNGFQQVASAIIGGLINEVPSCFDTTIEQQEFRAVLDAAGAASGVGDVIDGISEVAQVGTTAQMMVELFAKDSPVDTGYILVSPPPPAPAANVAVNPPSPTLTVTSAGTLVATAYDVSGNVIPNTSFTWTSSDQTVCQVSGTGSNATVTGLSPGVALITATAPSGKQGTATVTVKSSSSNLVPPVLTVPPAGVTNVSTTPSFSWTNVSGNAGYRIMVATSSSTLPSDPTVSTCASCAINATTATSVTSFTPTAVLSPGMTYYWQVHALTSPSSSGYGSWSNIFSFATAGSSNLPAPTLSTPANGTTSVSTTPSFSWTGASGNAGYRIMVATSSNGLPTDPKLSTCASCVINSTTATSVTSFTPSTALNPVTTYYWQVHALTPSSSSGYGSWSSIFSFTTSGSSNLPAPTLTAPANAATNVNTTPNFTWTDVTGNAGYRIMVATSSSALPTDPTVSTCAGCVINGTTATSATSYTPTMALNGGTTYYWEVHALTPSSNPGYGTWSSIFNFTVSASLPSVSGVSPNPVPGSNSAQQLTINGSNFASGATVTYHDPQGNPYPGHSTTFVNSGQIVDPQFNNANDAGTWTVTVVNAGGQSSNPRSFSVQ